jgi:hypothetical protein
MRRREVGRGEDREGFRWVVTVRVAVRFREVFSSAEFATALADVVRDPPALGAVEATKEKAGTVKFAECVPEELIYRMFAERLADRRGFAEVLNIQFVAVTKAP